MKLEKLNPKYKQVLDDIQSSIPKEWQEKVVKREPLAPATLEILTRSIEDDEVSEEFKNKARLILQSKILDKEIDTEVDDIAQLIDAYVELEISKAIVLKRLPKMKRSVPYKKALLRFNKLKTQYETRSN